MPNNRRKVYPTLQKISKRAKNKEQSNLNLLSKRPRFPRHRRTKNASRARNNHE